MGPTFMEPRPPPPQRWAYLKLQSHLCQLNVNPELIIHLLCSAPQYTVICALSKGEVLYAYTFSRFCTSKLIDLANGF